MSLASHGNSDFLVSDSFMYFPSCQVRVSILTHICIPLLLSKEHVLGHCNFSNIYIYIYILRSRTTTRTTRTTATTTCPCPCRSSCNLVCFVLVLWFCQFVWLPDLISYPDDSALCLERPPVTDTLHALLLSLSHVSKS